MEVTNHATSSDAKEMSPSRAEREAYKRNRRCLLLDTNFLLTCIKQKIDFFEEIKLMGIRIIIPKQVLNELKILEQRSNSNARIAFKLLKEEKFKEVDLGDNKTDRAIIKFAKKNSSVIIATLDKEIQDKIKNKKMIIRGRKKLEVV